MLQVFYGTDQISVRQKAHLAIEEVLSGDKDFIRLEADKYEAGELVSASSSASLFSAGAVYLVDTPSTNPIFFEEFIQNVEALATSVNDFIVVEEALIAEYKKKITKYASKVEEYKKNAEAKFNPFKMAEALAVKDKRSLWLLLQEAKASNMSAEEIIGILSWQLKSIRLAFMTKNFSEAGMKEYPYKKAKSALNTFKIEEVEQKAHDLIKLYHAGHRGGRDLDLALEEWVLRL
jgi:DNA polymerase III delta subunit